MAMKIEPHIVGEFEDSAMKKAFGQAGRGIFPASAALEKEILRQYEVKPVGGVPQIKEGYTQSPLSAE